MVSADAGSSSDRHMHGVLAYALLVVLVFGAYASSLPGCFVYDDFQTVVENPFVKSARGLGYLFSPNYFSFFSEYSYRPVVTLSYFADWAVWGVGPGGYHLTNVMLHAVMVVLVFGLVSEVSGRGAGFLGAALFAVHPLVTETVNGISFREDLLAGIFYAAAFVLYVRWRKRKRDWLFALAGVCYVLALLSKEMAATLPGVLLVYELAFRRGDRRKAAVPLAILFGIGMVYAGLRFTVLHEQGVPPDRYPEGSFAVNLLTMPGVFARYVWLMIFPGRLSIHHYAAPVRSVASFWAVAGIVAVIGYAAATVWGLRWDRRVGFGRLWFLIALAPVSNLVPIANIMAERYLYLPMAAYAILAGALIRKAGGFRGRGRAATVIAAVLIPIFALGTAVRNRDWSSEVRLWEKAVGRYPGSARAHAYLGAAYARTGAYEEAVEELKLALSLPTEDEVKAIALFDLGQSLKGAGRIVEAVDVLEELTKLAPEDWRAHTSLGATYMRLGVMDRAREEFERALELNPNDYIAISNMGGVYRAEGRLDEAIEMYRRAIGLAPRRGDFHSYLALALAEKGSLEEAWGELETAERLAEGDTVVLSNVGRGYYGLGLAYEESGDVERAAEAFERFLGVWEGDVSYAEAARRKLKELRGKVP